MKNAEPRTRHLSGTPLVNRLISIAVLVLFAGLIWAAVSGQFDREVGGFASWLQQRWFALLDWLSRLLG